MKLHVVTVVGLPVFGQPCEPTAIILGREIAYELVAWVVSRGAIATVKAEWHAVRRDDDEIRRGLIILSEFAHTRRL